MSIQEWEFQIGLQRFEVWFIEDDNYDISYQVYDNYIKEFVGKKYKYPANAYKYQGRLERIFMYGK